MMHTLMETCKVCIANCTVDCNCMIRLHSSGIQIAGCNANVVLHSIKFIVTQS